MPPLSKTSGLNNVSHSPFTLLKMINMCIICIDECTTVDTSLASRAAERTRSLSTDPNLAGDFNSRYGGMIFFFRLRKQD